MRWWPRASAAIQCQRLRQLWMRPDDNRLYGKLLRHLLQVAKALQVASGIEQAARSRIQLEWWQATGQSRSRCCCRGRRSSSTSTGGNCCRCTISRRQLWQWQRHWWRRGRWQRAAQVTRLVVVHTEALLVGAVRHAAGAVLQLQAARHRRVGAQRYVRVGAVRGCWRCSAVGPSAATAHARVVLVVLNAARGRERTSERTYEMRELL